MKTERGAGDTFEVRIGGSVQDGAQVGIGSHINQTQWPAKDRAPASKKSLSDQTGVFISYRRKDDPGFTGRLYDHLAAKFGRQNVFMDVSTIEPGADFAESINRSLSRCAALIAVIGEHWLGMTEGRGIARLSNPSDYVRMEIETALARGIRVIPVLVGNATVPVGDELPESMVRLARCQGISMSHANFAADVERLITAVDGAMKKQY